MFASPSLFMMNIYRTLGLVKYKDYTYKAKRKLVNYSVVIKHSNTIIYSLPSVYIESYDHH